MGELGMGYISTAEKIATIVLCRQSGGIGKLMEYIPGWFRVEADDLSFLVRSSSNGWHVSFRGTEIVHSELYIAVRTALEKACPALALSCADILPDSADW
jgi:hypothetical protein